METASVYLRLRPSGNACSQYKIDKNIFKTSDDPVTYQKDVAEKQFTFSNIFNGEASQYEIYNRCVHSVIEDEENLTMLTYGTSGSGKTFTLIGDGRTEPGIIPRAIEHIFTKHSQIICDKPGIKMIKGNVAILEDENIHVEERLRRLIFTNTGPVDCYDSQIRNIRKEHEFPVIFAENELAFIWISYAEIYNEYVYDLLSINTDNKENFAAKQGKRKALPVISNDGNAFIKDLTSVYVRNSAEALSLLSSGQKRVSYASTNINVNSSRSHCIFFMDVIRFKDSTECIHKTYKFCDLAGSERLKKTDNIGNRLKESQSINNSLMILGRCLDAVYQKSLNVPFRDSKLTTLLQAPLLGKEKISMIVNMLPTADFYKENINVLNFASMARQIVYKSPPSKATRCTRFTWFISKAANSPMAVSNQHQITILIEENDRLRKENFELQEELKQRSKVAEQKLFAMKMDFEQRLKKRNDLWQRRLDRKEKSLHEITNYKANINDLANREEFSDHIDGMKTAGTFLEVIDLVDD